MVLLADSVAFLEAHQPRRAACWSSLTWRLPTCSRCCPPTAGMASRGVTTGRCWAGSSGSCTPAGRGGICPSGLGPGRPATAGCAAGRRMGPGPGCGLCWTATMAQATIGGARPARRCWRRSQWQRLARAWWRRRHHDHHDHHSACRTVGGRHHTTTPARSAAGAPQRSRPGPGPNRVAVEVLEVLGVLRVQPPPAPARASWSVWARTAARNPRATIAKVACRYQAS
jgi:hypothetical protein